MTTVYYNFPEITLELAGLDKPWTQKIQLTRAEQPISNIQLNNVNYSALYIYITGEDTTETPKYLVVECFADVFNLQSNKIYVVFPLVVVPDKASSDIDNIIDLSNNSTKVNLNLNKYINKDGRCVVPNSPTFPLTVTLNSQSAIYIKGHADKKKFYTLSSISGLSVDKNPETNHNASLMQQDLDWIMSCELLTEDGEKEKTQIDPGTTATTISMCMMAIMIAGSTYLMGPTLYNEFGMRRLAIEVLDGNHYSINIYWGFHLILLALTCFGNAIFLNNMNYLFISIGMVLSYFSGTSAMSKTDIGNPEHTGIEKKPNQSIFAVFYAIVTGCDTWTGRILKGIVCASSIFAYFVMLVSVAAGSNTGFMSNLIFYLILVTLQLYAILYFSNKANPK